MLTLQTQSESTPGTWPPNAADRRVHRQRRGAVRRDRALTERNRRHSASASERHAARACATWPESAGGGSRHGTATPGAGFRRRCPGRGPARDRAQGTSRPDLLRAGDPARRLPACPRSGRARRAAAICRPDRTVRSTNVSATTRTVSTGYYEPFAPDPRFDVEVGRHWVKEGGGVLAVDPPCSVPDDRAVRASGLGRAGSGYLG